MPFLIFPQAPESNSSLLCMLFPRVHFDRRPVQTYTGMIVYAVFHVIREALQMEVCDTHLSNQYFARLQMSFYGVVY